MGLGFTSEEADGILEKVASSDDELSIDAETSEVSEETAADSEETPEGEETA
jgi:hypothetical protein